MTVYMSEPSSPSTSPEREQLARLDDRTVRSIPDDHGRRGETAAGHKKIAVCPTPNINIRPVDGATAHEKSSLGPPFSNVQIRYIEAAPMSFGQSLHSPDSGRRRAHARLSGLCNRDRPAVDDIGSVVASGQSPCPVGTN